MSLLFIAVLFIIPFLIDFFGKLFLAVGAQQAATFFQQNLWLSGVLGYLPIYLLLLFYLKTTFEPLSYFGYFWKKDYVWLSVYLGIGSGVVIYWIDWTQGIANLGIQQFSIAALLGYLVSLVILPSLTEETLFRGVVQNFYQRRFTKTFTKHKVHIAVFLGSAAELLFHLSVPIYTGITQGGVLVAVIKTLPQLVYVFVFGFIGGVLFQRTKSLVPAIIIHALGNLVELILIWSIH